MSKRRSTIIGPVLAAAAMVVTMSSIATADQSAAPLAPVRVQLDYVLRGNHAPFIVGKELGIFEKHGIDVTAIEQGKGSGPGMKIVAADQADFGFGDLPTLVVSRSQEIPVVALVAVNQKSPLSLCTLKDRHVLTEVADLEGLRMGVQTSGSTYVFFQAIVAANGVDRSKITELPVTPPYENYLLQGQVDVITCYIDAEVPELKAKAQDLGELSILHGTDVGYDVFGSGMYTSERMINDHPDVVQGFTSAYLEAFQWVIDNPEEAAAMVAASTELTVDKAPIFLEQLQADLDFTFTDETTEANGLGYMDPAKWAKTKDVLASQGLLATDVPVESIFNGSFQAAAMAAE
jgi:NitT/TauT family transport system substrate-binding protein